MPLRLPALLALAAALAAPAAAQTSHRVTVVVPEVELLAVSQAEVRLVFAVPAPGQPFADVVDGTARYAVTANTAGNKITGALDAALPDGLALSVALAPPAGASSRGPVALGADARDLVADLGAVGARDLPVTYTASVTEAAALGGAVEAGRTVTFTLTDQ